MKGEKMDNKEMDSFLVEEINGPVLKNITEEAKQVYESLKAHAELVDRYEKALREISAHVKNHTIIGDCSCHYVIGDMADDALQGSVTKKGN